MDGGDPIHPRPFLEGVMGDVKRKYPLDGWRPVAHWWEHPTGARVWLEYVFERGDAVQRWKASRPGRGIEHLGPFVEVGEAINNALCATAGVAEASDGSKEEGVQEVWQGEEDK